MKQIALDSVGLEHFRSFTTPTVIEFSAAPGLKLVSGANLVEPSLGANGAGKSTVFDAIAFALYGASVKGLRHGDLRAYGARSMRVMLLLQVDGQVACIERTAPPERILIDRQPATQADIDRLVGLTQSRFLNSVVFGQGVPLFLDLARPARGDLLDEVLSLEVWLEAAQRALTRHNRETAELTELRVQAERLDAALAAQPDLDMLRGLEATWEDERTERLRALIERHDGIKAEIAKLAAPPEAVSTDAVETARARYHEQDQEVRVLEAGAIVLLTERRRLRADIDFFRKNKVCPTCGTILTKGFRDKCIDKLLGEEAEADLALAEGDAAARVAREHASALERVWQEVSHKLAVADRQRAVALAQIDAKQREADDVERQAIRTRNEKNPYTAQREQAADERGRLMAALIQARGNEQAKAAQLTRTSYWRQGFRRCRAFCLENVLRELSAETRNSLLALGLPGWQVNFSTGDPDARRLGVEVEVRPPGQQAGDFAVLSGGEGQRARLAASLGLASLVQRWAGARFTWEVWDEPTAWLSDEGVEDLLDCLATRAETTGRSIYLCDHRALLNAGFTETYRVTKDVKGSHWERV